MYRYRGGVLKDLLDSAIALAYPDAKMSIAKLHDSEGAALLNGRDWGNNEVGVPLRMRIPALSRSQLFSRYS